MPTDRERLATLEKQVEGLEKWRDDFEKRSEVAVKARGVWVRWLITTLIGAAAAFGAVLAAEIARHG